MQAVNIRSLQHFLYCPHRWGLIELEQAWADNFFIARADVAHERVHSGEHAFSNKNIITYSDVTVFHDELGLIGKVDCIEFYKSSNGIQIPGKKGYFKVCVVEYKPSAFKNASYRIEDALQVYAQKVCVDNIFGCDCEGYIYYSDIRRRVHIPFETDIDNFKKLLSETLTQIKQFKEKESVPPPKRSKKCNGCSFKSFCMPNIQSSLVRKQILSEEDII